MHCLDSSSLTGWLRGSALARELSSLDLIPNLTLNYHPGVLHAGRYINVCAVPRMDVALCDMSTCIRWWILKILEIKDSLPLVFLRIVGEISLLT